MKGLMLLFQFMTRLPVPGKPTYDSEELGRSFKFFPIVGMIIGIILYATAMGLSQFIGDRYAIAILVVLMEVVVTGGLHLDGLADTFDGIFSYRSKHRMLEIMKDSRLGANGAIALMLSFMLKTFLIAEAGFGVLLIMPVLGRLNSVVNAAVAPYARATGMGKSIVANTDKAGVITAAILSGLFIFGSLGIIGGTLAGWISILLVVMGLGVFFAKLMERKIGGVTGDTLGAVVELTEAVVLLAACMMV